VNVVEFSTKTLCDRNGGATPVQEPLSRVTGSDGASWYAFQTRPRFEKKTEKYLRQRGLETFLPLLRQLHRWSDRRQFVDVPLFVGYGFVRLQITEHARLDVLRTPGVVALVGAHGVAAAIPTTEIEDLRRVLSVTSNIAGVPFLTTGKRVRIRGGALDGVEGILQENAAKNLVISVKALQRSLAIRIEGYSLELV
jgi:transcription termination/antitermination protein NusG